jgi:hypothetical protein
MSYVTPSELKHVRLRGHMRAYHNRVYSDRDPFAPMKREHDRQHAKKGK